MTTRADRIHLLNAYTFLGRRGECAVTSEGLPCTEDRSKVTCKDCLTAMKATTAPDLHGEER